MQVATRSRIAELALDGLGRIQHVARLRQQLAAAVVQHQPLADTVEQLHAQQALQFVQCSAGRRLRQRHQPGRRRGRTRLGHGQENLQLPQRDSHRSSVMHFRHGGAQKTSPSIYLFNR